MLNHEWQGTYQLKHIVVAPIMPDASRCAGGARLPRHHISSGGNFCVPPERAKHGTAMR